MLFDAAGHEHRDGACVWIEGGRIRAVYGREAPTPPPNAAVLDFQNGCILPGLIDSHVHLMLGLGVLMMLLAAHVYFAPFRRLRRAVGFAPSTPLSVGLARFAAWFCEYYGYRR